MLALLASSPICVYRGALYREHADALSLDGRLRDVLHVPALRDPALSSTTHLRSNGLPGTPLFLLAIRCFLQYTMLYRCI